jgi:hypothetical protein
MNNRVKELETGKVRVWLEWSKTTSREKSKICQIS